MAKASSFKQRASGSLYATTLKRLSKYSVLSSRTAEAVARSIQAQSEFATYQDLFRAVEMPTPTFYRSKKSGGVAVVDIPSRQQKEEGTIVIHLPMANPLDSNQLYQVATVALLQPSYRIIAFGNPSGAPYSFPEQNLTMLKRLGIGSLRNTRPLVAAEIDYLKECGVKNAHHVGYSYGAHKALIQALYSDSELIKSVTFIDPVAHPRGMKQLIEDFQNTFHPMGEYVNRTKLTTYFDARHDASETKHHKTALRRPINIAIGFLMARFDFITNLRQLLTQNPHIYVAVAWGSKSELGNDAHMSVSMHQLAHDYPEQMLSMRLEDDKHSVANDVTLYAAIIREVLSAASKN